MEITSEPNRSSEEIELRKQKILTHQEPSVTQSVADATVIKDDDIFFLCMPDGSVPLGEEHGFGLYCGDARYLSGYELLINGKPPVLLSSNFLKENASIHQLTNPCFHTKEKDLFENQKIGIEISREIMASRCSMTEAITFTNYSSTDINFDIQITVKLSFEDVFVIRGLYDEQPGQLKDPIWRENSLFVEYQGKDKRLRSLNIEFGRDVSKLKGNSVKSSIFLEAGKTETFDITYTVDSGSKGKSKIKGRPRRKDNHTRIKTDNLVLNRTIEQSFDDLNMLTTELEGRSYIAAGVPWFGTLFGRDSVITSLQVLPFDSSIARDTIELLAHFQGKEKSQWRDEEPGKILHEYRDGELARLNLIPHTPYYGSIDATPLYLILIGQYCQWTGDLHFFKQIKESVESALRWIDNYADTDGDGFYDYKSSTHFGLINQGWKDSGNAIINSSGEIAKPPIALVEVQGYVYQAKKQIATLYRKTGEESKAEQLERDAEDLKQRFNERFWIKKKSTFALGIDGNGELLDVVTSNPGHAFWSGIVNESLAGVCTERMFQEDLYSEWGIRTLSTQEMGYNPIGYHLGTVWPHDNSLIMSGLKKYGFNDLARSLFNGLLEASLSFENRRLPELFAGYSKKSFDRPIPYPVACHPQAWASGSLPFMLSELLGLRPDAFKKELRLVNPILPYQTDRIRLQNLKVGSETVDLSFTQTSHGTAIDVDRCSGDLKVIVEIDAHTRDEIH